jgi:mannose-6-phosphate isomerase-like protein (cupin superfamily)
MTIRRYIGRGMILRETLGQQTNINFELKKLPEKPNYQAPDGSEIRLLPNVKGGGLCHCTLPPKRTSLAMVHKTVEEIWYFIQGQGQVWRKLEEQESEVDVQPGICLTIPAGAHFQFRNVGEEPLCFLIATMPPWPGESEALRVQDHWPIRRISELL